MPPTEPDDSRIETAIKKRYSDATTFQYWPTGGPIARGRAYYIEFETAELDDDDCYYYAFVDKDECRLFDDGFELVNAIQVLTEKRKSLLERISDFDLPDLIGGLIAILLTVAIVVLM